MPPERERKRDPHRCLGCGASFDVSYYDDRNDERSALPPQAVDVSCPNCGHTKAVTVPAGAERCLEVELDLVDEADEGGGG